MEEYQNTKNTFAKGYTPKNILQIGQKKFL